MVKEMRIEDNGKHLTRKRAGILSAEGLKPVDGAEVKQEAKPKQ